MRNLKSILKGSAIAIAVVLVLGYAGKCDYEDAIAEQERIEELEYEMKYEQWRNSPEGRAEIARADSIYYAENPEEDPYNM